jgi:hypothetical protein
MKQFLKAGFNALRNTITKVKPSKKVYSRKNKPNKSNH